MMPCLLADVFTRGAYSKSAAAIELVLLAFAAGSVCAKPKYVGHGRNPYAVELPAHGALAARAGDGGVVLPLHGSRHIPNPLKWCLKAMLKRHYTAEDAGEATLGYF